ncbi:hypothetical protein GCM10010984_18640 [Chishuiella changwenlii]|nr:hypothetical protein GCM10010984_18640 [Chishuiella changwenlii]
MLILFLIISQQTLFSQSRTFINPGLEFGVTASGLAYIDTNFRANANSAVDRGHYSSNPWFTTHANQPGACDLMGSGNCHPIEVWRSGHGEPRVFAAEGINFVELNAIQQSAIYQNIYLRPGDVINYYFRHRARQFTSEQVAIQVYNQNQIHQIQIGTSNIPSSTSSWSINQNSVTLPSTFVAGVYRIAFQGYGGTPSVGNFLDDIRIRISPIIDLKYSNALSSCEGVVNGNGSLFLRINGSVTGTTTVAVELINPRNGNAAANNADINLTPVANSNGTPSVTHVDGTNIYLITIPPGNYDGGTTLGYRNSTNHEDGVRINITPINDDINEPDESFAFEIKPQNTNGATDNFDSTTSPVFSDTFTNITDDYTIKRCGCYDDANTSGNGIDSIVGITLLGRASEKNKDNWPMIRKGAHLVLESNQKGFVINRLFTTQIRNFISHPQEGMILYDRDEKCLKLYDGTSWACYNIPACP